MKRNIAQRAVKAAGGVSKVAREISKELKSRAKYKRRADGLLKTDISRQAIFQWKRVPAEHVKVMERLSGMPRHVLRSDLYDPIDSAASAKPADVVVSP